MKSAAIFRHTKAFMQRWMKVLAMTFILAVLLAIWASPYLERYRDKTDEEIISNNSKAVALINVFGKNHEQIGNGSGFFITGDGMLVTNYHVIRGRGISEIEATLPDTKATYFVKRIVAKDDKNDYALLQFDVKEVPYVHLGDSDAIKSGQKVIAIGAPLGLENTASEGIVSNVGRQVGSHKYIQFTAPISPGSSGGGLFDRHGEIIGITAAVFSGTQEEPGQNLNLAVPINLIRDKLSGKAAELPTDKASNCYLLGQLAANRHDFDEALSYYKQSIVLYDKDPDVYIAAANIFYEQGKYEKEVSYLEDAVDLAPKNYEAIYMLGNAYEDIGKYDDAIRMYKRALKLKPDDKNSMYYLAFISVVMKKDIKTARTILPQLMKLDPGTGKEIETLIKLASH